jgi:hypothetical protein
MLYPERTVSSARIERLKAEIQHRLNTNDWQCKLPRERHRYKLRTYIVCYGGFVGQIWQ